MTPHLSLYLLGPFQAIRDGAAVEGFESDKTRALLAYLAVECEKPHRRERLAALLWPERTEQAARGNLRQALTNLRRVLGEQADASQLLDVTRQTVRIHPDARICVDATELGRLANPDAKAGRGSQETLDRLEQAVALYRGSFLEGLSIADAAPFEEWITCHRERIHRQVMEALRRLVDGLCSAGEHERALGHAWRQLDLDPWREEAHRQAMRILALSGQRGAALAQFERCRQVLADELGVEPEAETIRLNQQIREGLFPNADARPHPRVQSRSYPAMTAEAAVREAATPALADPDREPLRLVVDHGSRVQGNAESQRDNERLGRSSLSRPACSLTVAAAKKSEDLVVQSPEAARIGKSRVVAAIATTALALAVVLGWLFRPSLPAPRLSGFTQLTHDGRDKIPPLLTDGARLYFTVATHAGWRLGQVSARGGDISVLSVPASLSWSRDGSAFSAKSPHSWLTDISPDGTELLAISWSASDGTRRPIWIVPTTGGSARRLGDVSAAGGAAWSPDGRSIACGADHDLRIVRSDGTETRTLATVTGNVRWPRWSPDGSRIRFMVDENGSSIWEVRSDGSGLKMVFAGWTKPPGEMPLAWTPDGAYFLFSARHNGARGIWAIREKGAMLRKVGRDPILLTKGPVDAWGAALSKDGRRLFVLAGAQQRGELMRYDRRRRLFVPYLRGISAEQVSYSRDGRWLAYVTLPEGTLWRCRIDGAECLQLTTTPFNVFGPRWSPDGKRIAFSGHEPNKPWNIYLVPARGGPAEHVFPENRAQCDPDWSPDGRFLVFGDQPPSTANRSLELLDLESRRLSTVPGSKGLFSPRWSPDGRHIVAVTMDIMEFRLFDVARRKWRALVSGHGIVAWPCWSRDGGAVFFLAGFGGGIYRVDLTSRKVTQVADSGGMRLKGRFDSFFCVTSDDAPLILRDLTAAEIHVCDWQTP